MCFGVPVPHRNLRHVLDHPLTVKQVVQLHPTTVEKKVVARTQAIRQHLDSIEAREVIRQEAVKQQVDH